MMDGGGWGGVDERLVMATDEKKPIWKSARAFTTTNRLSKRDKPGLD